MRREDIPDSVVTGCVALLKPYVGGLTADRFLDLIAGESPGALKPIRRIAQENGINPNTLYHFVELNKIAPRGKVRGVKVFNAASLMARFNELKKN